MFYIKSEIVLENLYDNKQGTFKCIYTYIRVFIHIQAYH